MVRGGAVVQAVCELSLRALLWAAQIPHRAPRKVCSSAAHVARMGWWLTAYVWGPHLSLCGRDPVEMPLRLAKEQGTMQGRCGADAEQSVRFHQLRRRSAAALPMCQRAWPPCSIVRAEGPGWSEYDGHHSERG